MSSDTKVANLTLHIDAGEDADAEELDHLTRQLLGEIQELDVESVELAGDEVVPEGAKAVDPVTLGVLAVAVLPTVIPALITYLQTWSMRGAGRTVKLKTQKGDQSVEVEYDPKTMSPAELKSLVETLNETLATTADE